MVLPMQRSLICEAHLRGGEALLGKLAHVLGDLLCGDLEPRGRAPLVGEGRLGDTLPGTVHAPHLVAVVQSVALPQ